MKGHYPFYKLYYWADSRLKLASSEKFEFLSDAHVVASGGINTPDGRYVNLRNYQMFAAYFTDSNTSTLIEMI